MPNDPRIGSDSLNAQSFELKQQQDRFDNFMPHRFSVMLTQQQMQTLHPKGRALFCLAIAKSLPSLPSQIESQIGKTSLGLIDTVLKTLDLVVTDDEVDLTNLSVGLRTIIDVAERKAAEVESAEYKPGDNYGFSGAADTYSEIYRYLGAYVLTLARGVALDVEGCINAFRGAVKLYAIHSCHGDPKGAIHREIEEAEERCVTIIADIYAAIPNGLKDQEVRPVTKPQPEEDTDDGFFAAASVFVSFKNLAPRGQETRDCQIAKKVTQFLRKRGVSVFFSLDTLEQIGTSAYKKVIDDALDAAKILVVVGTSQDHLESGWVRYEWDGFLNDILSGVKPKGEIFTLIEGVAPQDLPRGLRQHQVFPYHDDGLEKLAAFITRKLKN